MKSYPSIDKQILSGEGYAFDKLDGSNIRAEWSRSSKNFFKFGSRTQLLDENHPILGSAISIFKEKYGEDLSKKFYDTKHKKGVAFLEFFGESSFAGQHKLEENKNLVLFDLSGDRGLFYPKDFLHFTKNIETAKLLYEGPLTSGFINLVKEGKLEGMTFEGVIFKMNTGTPGLPSMTKIKNKHWIEKLRSFCKNDEELFKKLL